MKLMKIFMKNLNIIIIVTCSFKKIIMTQLKIKKILIQIMNTLIFLIKKRILEWTFKKGREIKLKQCLKKIDKFHPAVSF